MNSYETALANLRAQPKKWLVTGVAGFIGSNLLEGLLKANQQVIGLDNFSTGFQRNLDDVKATVGAAQWQNFQLIEGDICALADCARACAGVDYVLHHAAMGSVPRSVEDPIGSNQNNVDGFLNMLVAARDAKVASFTYASSSAVYGDHPDLPKVEEKIGKLLSPYALTKYANELYADVFARSYGFNAIGLRYFNIFGRRQDPASVYAAVIPAWVSAMIHDEPVFINGDGETSRDFCYVKNVIQANILAATATEPAALNQIYNVSVGGRTSLNELYAILRKGLTTQLPHLANAAPEYRAFRVGDIRHSQASIGKASSLLGFEPPYQIGDGLEEALPWYLSNLRRANA